MVFRQLLNERILILDGGMGTMIQCFNPDEADYRGERFADHKAQLKGNYDLLSLTRPDMIRTIHRQYLDAGADIITTNTLNVNAVSMADYGMQEVVREMNVAAGRLARETADDFMRERPERTVFVAGSIGPTNKTASISQNIRNPAHRDVAYADLYHAFREQTEALIEGGADLLLFETVFDTLNLKAGLDAAVQTLSDLGRALPLMVSLTLSGQGGRSFSGQTIAAFLAAIRHAPVTTVGLNCSFGAADMLPHLRELAGIAPFPVSAYPNAGLPDSLGEYKETPDDMEAHIRTFIKERLVNIVGGCCGSTPAHIARFPALVQGVPPRRPVECPRALQLSGLELLEVKPENNFVNIGERCNVAGSRRFLRLIREESYAEALSIARRQVDDGAQIIDINMDDGLLDAQKEMTTFLRLIAAEPDIARVPLMIDSSRWEVIEVALQCVQGKSIVNSISLKEGKETFLARARYVQRLGAAVVVMAFDEQGQADTFERRIEICERAYRLLTEQAGFPPEDIIFDPNVLAIATGISEHNRYGSDFIRAVAWIKRHLPGVHVSGGISNLSFAFRGNSFVREAMHAVFLYHAIRAGLDMGIVNPATSVTYDEIEPSFRALLEDVILARRPEAADELSDYAREHTGDAAAAEQTPDAWHTLSVNERLEHALLKGVDEYLESDLAEVLQGGMRAVEIIDGPLMNGMNRVGELFGAGKMFLPQVVKTARTMEKAVSILQPALEAERTQTEAVRAGKMVFATVKGDVHDIGKNIVSIVLACNNYEVVDLGVMTPAARILEAVAREKPDFLCLSGLITPSLDEMAQVAKEMQHAGHRIPIMIGGATTSRLHTALRIAPHYDAPVIHVTDASQSPLVAARLLNPATRDAFIRELNENYAQLRRTAAEKSVPLLTLAEARARRPAVDWSTYAPPIPAQRGIHEIAFPFDEVVAYINWIFFFTTWRMSGRYGELSRLHNCEGCRTAWLAQFTEEERARAGEALQLYRDALALLEQMKACDAEGCRALCGIFPAASEGDDILIGDERLSVLRRQSADGDSKVCLSLADWVMPAAEGRTDYVGAFAVTAGAGWETLRKALKQEGDAYRLLLLQTLSDRMAEAGAERLHEWIRKTAWGYAADENLPLADLFRVKYRGIRPAVGYPSLPDQRQIFALDRLLKVQRIGVSLTENGAMKPAATVAGFCFAHPDARYFPIGRITEEQLNDYATRRRESPESARKFLAANLI
jgi:5-methyltetrahydrofolate--homocysteine methyltransferase